MSHEATLIATIAVSLAYAFVGGYIATRLRLPAIVGYLLARVAVGRYTPGFVADAALAEQLAEIWRDRHNRAALAEGREPVQRAVRQ